MAKHSPHPQPKLTPLTSSALSGFHHDPDTRALTVKFNNGTTWLYENVPHEKVEAFSGAASPGRFFSSRIRDQYAGRKL